MSLDWIRVLRFFHLFFAFSFVGSLIIIEWNGRAARAAAWRERAVLYRILFLSTTVWGLGGLIFVGVLGNVLSVALGYRMATDAWLRWVNALWLIAALLMAFVNVPGAGALARISKRMAEAGDDGAAPPEFAPTLTRWRIANVAQTVLYLALLVLMVFRWRGVGG